MLKKLTLLVVILTVLVVPVSSAFAQEDERWVVDLSETFTVEDLAFTFPYPTGWVLDNSNGITLAANEAELLAATDDDPATKNEDFTIRLIAFPLESLELTAEATLDEVADEFIALSGIELAERFDFPMLSRRTVVLTGTDTDGDEGVLNLWIQDGMVVSMGFGTPASVGLTEDFYYTWGALLAQSRAISDVELSEALQADNLGGITVYYPTGWATVLDETGFLLGESEEDVNAFNTDTTAPINGTVVGFFSSEMAQLEVPPDLTVELTLQNLVSSGSINEPTTVIEHIVFDAPALLAFSTSPDNGLPVITVVGIVDGIFYFFYAQSPDEETQAAFYPILLNMLADAYFTE